MSAEQVLEQLGGILASQDSVAELSAWLLTEEVARVARELQLTAAEAGGDISRGRQEVFANQVR